jgi:RNA polymerase sigma-70 factor (ECF subfamily)
MDFTENKTPKSFQTLPAVFAVGASTMIDPVVRPNIASGRPREIDRLRFTEDYLQALANRAEDTVQHLISHFSSPVKSKLAGSVRSPGLREDAFQETFQRVLTYFQSGKTLENPASLPAFVFSVCHNTALELLRRGSRYQQSQELSDPVDPAQSPEDRMIAEERRQIARRILQELQKKDRELLQRVFLDEEDKDSVCKQLGVDRGYLRVLLHRARMRMKMALAASPFASSGPARACRKPVENSARNFVD